MSGRRARRIRAGRAGGRPPGAVVGLWQRPREGFDGATRADGPGTFIWTELMTNDVDAAVSFHERVPGLQKSTVDPFTGLVAGSDMIGGVIPPHREGAADR